MKLERKTASYLEDAWPDTVPKIVQQIYANRGVFRPEGILKDPSQLLPPSTLKGILQAAEILGQAIIDQKHFTVAGDYDCDGATGTAVGVRGLKLLGAQNVHFTIPNRDRHGYGLSVGLVEELPQPTDVIVTVDSGIASIDGVKYAKEKGYTVVITDHHLAGNTLPNADAIVNPNQPGCEFPSKSLAGVGVMLYTLLAVKRYLGSVNHPGGNAALFQELLPLVAVGTIADLVPLDQNNRILVSGGLHLIHSGQVSPGIRWLLNCANKDPQYLTSTDIAFGLAPRINAAGRLADMTLGVKLLLSDDDTQSRRYALSLDEINKARKDIQEDMVVSAESLVEKMDYTNTKAVVLYEPTWHHGVVGLVASKLKEALHRPVIAFAGGQEKSKELRGSARSIPGFHLRDALALVDARHPGLISKFGGHAMAAGLSLPLANLDAFTQAFYEVVDAQVTPAMLEVILYSDGELAPNQLSENFARYLETCGPWGQGFPKPLFDGVFEVKESHVLGEKHLKLELHDTRQGDVVEAMWFFADLSKPLPQRFRMAYELDLNRFRNRESLQLIVRYVAPYDSH